MCDPIAIIGAVISGVGAMAQGMQQAAAAENQAAWQQRQAVIEQQRGEYEAGRERDRAKQLIARQRGGFLSAGVSLEGTPEDVIMDTTAETELDVQAIRYGAQIKSDSFTAQAQNSRMNASSARMGAVFGAITPMINAAGSTRMRSAFG